MSVTYLSKIKEGIFMKEKIIQIDTLDSIEFDLTEAIKDLIYNVKSIKKDLEDIKNEL